MFKLEIHVLLDLVHRHVAGALDHHLHVVFPRDLGEFSQGLQFGELRLVIGVAIEPGRKPSPKEKLTS